MNKVIDNFKKMPLLMKIASIVFIVVLVLFLSARFVECIYDVFENNIFRLMFKNVYNFFSITLYDIRVILEFAYICALVAALFSGSKKNVAFVLLIKAMLTSLYVFFTGPFLRVLTVISYGFNVKTVTGTVIWKNFIDCVLILAYIALAILLLDGFGKLTKPLGFASVAVFSFILLVCTGEWIGNVVDMIKLFVGGNIKAGIYTLLIDNCDSCVSILWVALTAKNLAAPKNAPEQQQPNND